jgi:hypothetical protein
MDDLELPVWMWVALAVAVFLGLRGSGWRRVADDWSAAIVGLILFFGFILLIGYYSN